MIENYKNSSKQIIQCSQHGEILSLILLYNNNRTLIHWSDCTNVKTGDTPLHLAAQNNHLEIVKFLCETWLPSYIEIQNNDGKKPLHDAAQFHNYSVIEYLLSKGAVVDPIKRADWTPLMLACAKLSPITGNTIQCVELLLSAGANPAIKNKDGWNSLHLAARTGDPKLVELLTSNHSGILLQKSKNGRTPLHIAALHGHYDIVKFILKQKLILENIDIQENCGNTPLLDSVLSGNIDLFKLIMNAGGSLSNTNKNGLGCVHLASQAGHADILLYLIEECQADVNMRSTTSGFVTPLHCACRSKHTNIIAMLEQHNADKNCTDRFGRTPYYYLNL